jgi:dihydrofolate reductase
MRSVAAAEYVTLDGVMQDPGGVGEIDHGGWSNPYFNEELAEYQTEQLFASDALLLGRETFEGFAAAWPAQEEAEGDFGVRMNTLPKYVASRTLRPPLPWNGSLLEGDVARGRRRTEGAARRGHPDLRLGAARQHATRTRPHRPLPVDGFPVMLGAGKRLFNADDLGLKAFMLADTATTDTGVAMLTYEAGQS